jgi:hypothetical protein
MSNFAKQNKTDTNSDNIKKVFEFSPDSVKDKATSISVSLVEASEKTVVRLFQLNQGITRLEKIIFSIDHLENLSIPEMIQLFKAANSAMRDSYLIVRDVLNIVDFDDLANRLSLLRCNTEPESSSNGDLQQIALEVLSHMRDFKEKNPGYGE